MNVLIIAAGIVAAIAAVVNRDLLAASVSLLAFGHAFNIG